MLSIPDKLDAIDWDFPNSNTADGINSIHPYPAKFIQEIPKTLIQIIGVPPETWILDPFCGSGVTLVEAQQAGIPSIGIDLNPIACLISRVKTQPLAPDFLECAKEAVERAKESNQATIPNIPNLDHWFTPDIQEAVAQLLRQFRTFSNTNTLDALRVTLSSILVRVSNQDSDTRYAAIKKDIDKEKFYSLFLASAKRLWVAKSSNRSIASEAKVICGDILQITRTDIQHPIGLVITSPPYPNAYEYWLYHKYRMFWLGYDPIQVKRQEIGARAHYFKKNPPTTEDFRCQMRNVFDLLWATVVNGGHICFLMGRSKIHGEIVDNASILIEIAQEVGLVPLANITRQIAASRKTFNLSHANIHTENLLVFTK